MIQTAQKVAQIIKKSNHLVVLVGAGLSAESGIPTFRGKDGYWRVGSKNYHPSEMATLSAFRMMPHEVWAWYDYRRKKCLESKPNDGHYALVELEKIFKRENKKFHIITQNVDGLNLRAGNSPDVVFQIHGNINYMRDAEAPEWSKEAKILYEIPENATLDENGVMKLPNGHLARPHVLWFDEVYDEELYKFESSLKVAKEMDALIFIGTTLQTNLPYRIVTGAMNRNIPIVEVNIEPVGVSSKEYICVTEKSGVFLPQVIKALKEMK